VVPASRRDFERAFRGDLTSDLIKVRQLSIAGRRGRAAGGNEVTRSVEESQDRGDGRGSKHAHVRYSSHFRHIFARYDQRLEIGLGATSKGHRENASHGANRSVQPELADECCTSQSPGLYRACSGQDANQERKIEGRTCLGDISRREVYRDSQAGNPQPEIRGCSSDALHCLTGRRWRQPAGPNARRTASNRDFDADSNRFYTDERERVDDVKHTSSCSPGFNVTSNGDRFQSLGTGARSRSPCWSE
jgi:hypothetical protein